LWLQGGKKKKKKATAFACAAFPAKYKKAEMKKKGDKRAACILPLPTELSPFGWGGGGGGVGKEKKRKKIYPFLFARCLGSAKRGGTIINSLYSSWTAFLGEGKGGGFALHGFPCLLTALSITEKPPELSHSARAAANVGLGPGGEKRGFCIISPSVFSTNAVACVGGGKKKKTKVPRHISLLALVLIL